MKLPKRFCMFAYAALLSSALFTTATPIWGANATADGVVQALEKKYAITETTTDFAQITKDGATLSLKCPGVYSIPGNLMMKPDNKVVDGKVQAPGTLAKYTLVKMGAHVLQTGEKVYVTKIEGKSELTGDTLKFTLLTVDALEVTGSEARKKYEAYVSFKFKKGYLDETPPDQIEQTIESVVAPEEAAAPETQQAPATVAKAAPPAPPVAAAPLAPPVSATPPPSINVGESSSQVLKDMGMPLQMIDLGRKKTYVYKTMKVVFLNDKVSDVQ